MFVIEYYAPYTGQLRYQEFDTLAEAKAMIRFYAECGTKAVLV